MTTYPAWIRARQRDKWKRRLDYANMRISELETLQEKYANENWSDFKLYEQARLRIDEMIEAYDTIVINYLWMLDHLSGG